MPLRRRRVGVVAAVAWYCAALISPGEALEVVRATAAARSTSALRRWGGAALLPYPSIIQKPILLPEAADRSVHSAPGAAEPAAAEAAGSAWTAHHIWGIIIFGCFALSICLVLPVVRRERGFFEENVSGGGDSFAQYMQYRFADWFTGAVYAPSVVLVFVTVALIVCGAIMYSLIVGGSPSHGLWRIFVWSTGSPAEGESTVGGRFLGTLVTVCGLIILSLLLSIVTEVFSSKMNEIRQGQTRVVEGGHVVILGFTECTRCLLEELGKARESDGGGVFVILAPEDKEIVEAAVAGDSLDIRGSRVIVRQGNPHGIRDLQKVAAGSASQIVILADTSIAPEDADAKSLRTMLALATKGWPQQGRIVLQCVVEANRDLFKELCPESSDKVEVVVVGNIVAKLMAASMHQHGLAGVFGMMLGFDGDEFYSEEWPQLVGSCFRDVVFRFPDAVVLGVLTAERACLLNPGWDYTIQEGDKVIVLAEDNDTYRPEDKAWHESGVKLPEWGSARMSPMAHGSPRGGEKVLIIGWNNKIGALLDSLDTMLSAGSSVDIYSPRSASMREDEVRMLVQIHGDKNYSFAIKQLEVDATKTASFLELSQLNHHQYAGIFILADFELDRRQADERTMMCLTQLQRISRKLNGTTVFDPVVEMCEDSTAEHLRICGLTNFVHSNSLVSQALAAVTENPSVNSIYADLMSGLTNHFEFRRFEEFLDGHKAPSELSFWEAAYHVSLCGNISVVAWTTPGERLIQMNPKDKTTRRPWTAEDRLVVIRRSTDSGA